MAWTLAGDPRRGDFGFSKNGRNDDLGLSSPEEIHFLIGS